MGGIPRPLTPQQERRILAAQERLETTERDAQQRVREALAARDAEILKATEAGASAASIGRALGITRQAVGLAAQRARQRGQ